MPEKVGFVGLGIMGKPMARNLMQAGYDLVVHNRSRGKPEELGAEVVESPREIAERVGVVFTMLPGPPEVREIVAGRGGILEGASEGSLIVDMSTSSPVLARELALSARERGVGMLDAPVSGGDVGAEEGTLSIMAGGSEQDFGRAKSLFEVMGKTIVHVGEVGAGQTVKACNQIVVALVIEAVSEALVLGSKAGVDPAKVIEVLSGGLAGNKVMEVKKQKFVSHDFEPGGQGRVPPEGPRDSPGSRQGIQGPPASHGGGRPDVRGPCGEGPERLGPLGGSDPNRRVGRARDRLASAPFSGMESGEGYGDPGGKTSVVTDDPFVDLKALPTRLLAEAV